MTNEINRVPLDALESLNFKISERERWLFQVWCIERGISQADTFRKGIELLRTQDGTPE